MVMYFQFYFKYNFTQNVQMDILVVHVLFHTPYIHGRVDLLFNLAPKSCLLCHHCVASVSTIGPRNEN